MRLTAALLAPIIALTGCATTTGRNAGAVCAIASSIAVATTIAGQHQQQTDSEAPPPAVYILAGAIVAAAISGGIAIGAEITAPRSLPVAGPATQPPGMCDPRAEALTHEAQQAARLGQCSAVVSLGERVHDIDPGCYAVEFVLIRCA